MNDTLLIALVFALAGFVKGVIGLGLPTIAMGLLGLWLAPVHAAGLLLVPSVVTNIVQASGSGIPGLLRLLWPMLLGVLLGTVAGWWLWGGPGGALAAAGLGAMLLAYGVIGLLALRPRLAPATALRLAMPAGAITGAITAGTGIFVIPMVPWLQAIGLPRERMVQALGVSLLVSALSLGLVLGLGGALSGGVAWASVLALAPTLAGQWAGTALRQRLDEVLFRRVFFGGLMLLGLHLLWRAIR